MHVIISSIGTPTGRKPKDGTTEGDEGSYFCYAQCRSGNDSQFWSCNAQQDKENDGHRYPGITFITVNVAVSIDTEKRCQYCNDENTYLLGNRSPTQGSDQLTTHNNVDSRPTNAFRDI